MSAGTIVFVVLCFVVIACGVAIGIRDSKRGPVKLGEREQVERDSRLLELFQAEAETMAGRFEEVREAFEDLRGCLIDMDEVNREEGWEPGPPSPDPEVVAPDWAGRRSDETEEEYAPRIGQSFDERMARVCRDSYEKRKKAARRRP